ncbi:acyltransferase [Rhizobium sp. KVB221]|uniref:Acyltransferase n=1 Tax=Rhizobium setariae TaxID=2801340 RepID=A0A936YUK7_9HYPH|nr:acyltransferase [Rhizobium setariae]MBL0373516.1 acyltransferase [Rhizobium setariae]
MLVQIQYIRAIAALLVVYFHAILQLQKLDPNAALAGAAFGESGVDLFFVLSGFVMWITTSGKQISMGDFYWKRIRRIVPLYWSATILAALIALIVPSILRSTVFDAPHMLASLFFIPWINPADPSGAMIAPVIVPGWTLNYEMYFYLMFGALLLLPRAVRLVSMIGAFVLMSVSCWLMPTENTASLFYGNLVVFEFVAGTVLGHFYVAGHRLAVKPALSLSLIAVATIVLLVLDYSHLPVDRLFKMGVPAAIIVYAATAMNFSKLPTLSWLRYLGDASYSIYITHIFVLAGARMLYGLVPFDALKNEILFVGMSLGLSVLVGILVHAFFESPVDRYLSRRGALRRSSTPDKIAAATE